MSNTKIMDKIERSLGAAKKTYTSYKIYNVSSDMYITDSPSSSRSFGIESFISNVKYLELFHGNRMYHFLVCT